MSYGEKNSGSRSPWAPSARREHDSAVTEGSRPRHRLCILHERSGLQPSLRIRCTFVVHPEGIEPSSRALQARANPSQLQVVVNPTGFEPVSGNLRGSRPGPLDDGFVWRGIPESNRWLPARQAGTLAAELIPQLVAVTHLHPRANTHREECLRENAGRGGGNRTHSGQIKSLMCRLYTTPRDALALVAFAFHSVLHECWSQNQASNLEPISSFPARDGADLGAVRDDDRRRVLDVHKASDGDEMRPNQPVPSGRHQDGLEQSRPAPPVPASKPDSRCLISRSS